jgi:hypothetical protein
MKKYAGSALAVLALIYLLSPVFAGGADDDLRVIKKAVKENPHYETGKEVQWFKVLVTDNKTNRDVMKVAVPLCLVEIFLGCAKDTKIKTHQGDAEIDLRAVFKELKARGPMALIEIHDDDATVKIWLE